MECLEILLERGAKPNAQDIVSTDEICPMSVLILYMVFTYVSFLWMIVDRSR